MNVNSHAEELYKKGNVSAMIDYLSELFGASNIDHLQYGFIYDVNKYSDEDVNRITSLGLHKNYDNFYEGFNLIDINYLRRADQYILKTQKVLLRIFQVEDGSWMISGLNQLNDITAEGKFEKTTYNKITDIFTDIFFKNESDFDYADHIANRELVYVYNDMMEVIKLTDHLFQPNETNTLSKIPPTYSRFKFFMKSIKPILNEIGIKIEKTNIFENNDVLKKILSISKNNDCFRFHCITFDYNGINYEICRDFESLDDFLLMYNNVTEELSSFELLDRLSDIKSQNIGIELYNGLFEKINSEDGMFVGSYMQKFTKFTELMEEVSIHKGISAVMSDRILQFSKCSVTMLATTIPHDTLIRLIDESPSDVVRLCHATYKKYNAWFDTRKIIHLQDTETGNILKFDDLKGFDQHLESKYKEKLNEIKK